MLISPPNRLVGARLLSALLVAAVVVTLVPLIPAAVETFTAEGQDVPADTYPGKEDGFERGVDANGTEVYRYEYNNQVYVVPAEQYYGWREEHYHGSLTPNILQILLLSHMYSVMAYPRTYYYSTVAHSGWHAPTTAYYSSAAYSAHYGTSAGAHLRTHCPTAL